MAQKKRNIKFGIIFWIVFILLVLLLFFINKENISAVLKTADFSFLSKSKAPDAQEQIQNEIERINEASETSDSENVPFENKASEFVIKTDTSETETAETSENKKLEVSSVPKDTEQKKQKNDEKDYATKSAEDSAKKKTQAAKTQVKTTTVKIYFVTIDPDGRISRVSAERILPVSASPMSDALKTLFSGTTTTENNKAYRSLIPPNTKLLSATVREGVAYINVNENFEFNKYGIEGYIAELAQVVYTATEFPTVKAVQFLIEGNKKNYLGSDGVWIGSPLSRDSF